VRKRDVLDFSLNLEDNIFKLRDDVESGKWEPDPYKSFYISDPKLRHIHKASVRDRVLYQAIYRILYPHFNNGFISDIYSSRNNKGTHLGVKRLESFLRKSSRNYTRQTFALKCDIRKFFDSIDHQVLLKILGDQLKDEGLLGLLERIIKSFEKDTGKGMPLGNVTSQLFANIYMNSFDWYMKEELRIRYYVRYCDDFVIIDQNHECLSDLIPKISNFLNTNQKLTLHPAKITIRKLSQGIDFLGYVVLPHRIAIRTKTKRRIIRKFTNLIRNNDELDAINQTLASYKGHLSHAKSYKITKMLDGILE
jgi:RNA-directed DNA polymerase